MYGIQWLVITISFYALEAITTKTCSCLTPNQGTRGFNKYQCHVTDCDEGKCTSSTTHSECAAGEACVPNFDEVRCETPSCTCSGGAKYTCNHGARGKCSPGMVCMSYRSFYLGDVNSVCRRPTCNCSNPGRRLAPARTRRRRRGGRSGEGHVPDEGYLHNDYFCDDFTWGSCRSDQACSAETPFEKSTLRGCVADPSATKCKCLTPDSDTQNNEFMCNDGSYSKCREDEWCSGTDEFIKTDLSACKSWSSYNLPKCACTKDRHGIASDGFECTDPSSDQPQRTSCPKGRLCSFEKPFLKTGANIVAACAMPTCTCSSPDDTTPQGNRYYCSDFSWGYCASTEACSSSQPFAKHELPSVCAVPTCRCTTPHSGTIGGNSYTCTDGTSAHCSDVEECSSQEEFPKTKLSSVCTVPLCKCTTPHHGTAGGNSYTCSDGTSSHCAADEECGSNTFSKTRSACVRPECRCKTPNIGAQGYNSYHCSDGTLDTCASDEVCFKESTFTKGSRHCKKPVCDPFTGDYCRFFGCAAWRGSTCRNGRCMCGAGMCSHGGRCNPPSTMCNEVIDGLIGIKCFVFPCSGAWGPTECIGHECICKKGYCFFQGKCQSLRSLNDGNLLSYLSSNTTMMGAWPDPIDVKVDQPSRFGQASLGDFVMVSVPFAFAFAVGLAALRSRLRGGVLSEPLIADVCNQGSD